jgi:transcriptional regulator with XRE-family HTH domain
LLSANANSQYLAAKIPSKLDSHYIVGLIGGRRVNPNSKRLTINFPNKDLADRLKESFGGSIFPIENKGGSSYRWTLSPKDVNNLVHNLRSEFQFARAMGFYISPMLLDIVDQDRIEFKDNVQERMSLIQPKIQDFSLLEPETSTNYTRIILDDEGLEENKNETLAYFLKFWREKIGNTPEFGSSNGKRLSRRQVASLSYMHPTQYADIESGFPKQQVSYENLVRFSIAMGMDEAEATVFVWSYFEPEYRIPGTPGPKRQGPKFLKE